MTNVYQKITIIKAEQFDGSQKYMFGHKVMSEDSLVDALTHDPVYKLSVADSKVANVLSTVKSA